MPLWQATFIFEKKEYDNEFYALDSQIEQAALASQSYLGMESYQSQGGQRLINNYYRSIKKVWSRLFLTQRTGKPSGKVNVGWQVIRLSLLR